MNITENLINQKRTFEYNFLVFDWEIKNFKEKNIELYLHQLDWQAFDLELNKKELYQLKNKFDHELHFLIFDDKKKTKKKSNKNILKVRTAERSSKNSVTTTNSSSNDINPLTPRRYLNLPSMLDDKFSSSISNKTVSVEKKNEHDEESLKEKFNTLIKLFDDYLAKNCFTNYKLIDNIKLGLLFESFSEDLQMEKITKYFFVNFKKYNFDWILVEHSTLYEEKTPFYFSLKWLACQSCYVHMFLRDLGKRIKQNSFKLLKVPFYDFKELPIFKRCLEWDINAIYLLPIFINILKKDKFFKNCWFLKQENDYLILGEEYNLFLTISTITGKVILNEENYDPEIGLTQTSNINRFWEFTQTLDMYIKIFSVFNNFSLEIEKNK